MSPTKKFFGLAAVALSMSASPVFAGKTAVVSTRTIEQPQGDPTGRVAPCAVAHAVFDTSCAPSFLNDAVFPHLMPLKVQGIHFDPKVDKPTDKVDEEFDVDIELESVSLASSGKPNENQVTTKGNAVFRKVKTKITESGREVIKEKAFRLSLEAGALVRSFALPAETECRSTRPTWAGLALNFKVTELKKVKIEPLDPATGEKKGVTLAIPSFLTNNKLVLGILNWVFKKHVFSAVTGAPEPGLPFCMTTGSDRKPNCPNMPLGVQDKLQLVFGHQGSSLITLDLSTTGAATGAPLSSKVTASDTMRVCKLVEGVLANACTTELTNRVLAYNLPFSTELPEAAIGSKGIRAIAKEATVATNKSGVSATVKAALSNGTAEEFTVEASGSSGVIPQCAGRSFALTVSPKLDRLTTSSKIPIWVIDGLVRTLVNRAFEKNGPVVLPLKSKPLKEVSSEIRVCGIVERLLKSNGAHGLANSLSSSVLPMEFKVADLLTKGVKLPDNARAVIAGVFDGVTVKLSALSVTKSASSQAVAVAVEIKKAGESRSFSTSGEFLIDAKTDCAKGKESMSLQFQLGKLTASEIPSWLTDSTGKTMINNLFTTPKKFCLLGTCE